MRLKFYLAGSFDRRDELRGYAERLEAHGHEITSRWLDPTFTDSRDLEQNAFADLHDIEDCHWMLQFTGSGTSGGRHVELGIALALHKQIEIIGPKENVFHHLGDDPTFKTFDEFVKAYLP